MRFVEILKELEEVKSRHQKVKLSATIADLDVIILFVQKIIEILKCDEKIRVESRPSINTEITREKEIKKNLIV